eukprot:TRINITY_DN9976_c0_g1_i2.p2 TRINITY_DN9976_c0_g1~~TRINITY_DN9976_c0_g1_i2.p2  ORF type:complete len:163 (+),score=75.69 TRINITY_DN9976_c0_g1_i2:180-668(+)
MSGHDEVDAGYDIFYVCKKTLEAVRAKLKKGEEITKDLVEELSFPEKLADEEMMVPVDMRGTGADFEDVEEMLEKLGPKGTAEAFAKAADYFEKAKESMPEEERPQPMTAAEWRQVLEDDDDGFGFEDAEEEFFEDEEEELLEDDLDLLGGSEPPAKKFRGA